jgi:PDZ domain-containing protein
MTEAPPAPPASRRRLRLSRALILVLVVLGLAAAAASRVTLNYYVLSPGQAQPVGPLIKVPSAHAHGIRGPVLLTDVYVAPVTLLGYLPDLLSPNDEIVSSDQLTGGVPSSELNAQGYLEMVQSKDAAKTAALRRLGYPVPEHDAGAVVGAISAGTPAYPVLKVGQVITAVDGVATPTSCAFAGQLAALAPGQQVVLSVKDDHFTASGSLVSGPVVRKTLRLAKRPAGLPAQPGCPGVTTARGFLGVSVQTQQDFTYPFPITINTANIGGPSAGLAMTLGLINTLSTGDLTGGRKIAATGTIDPAGNVGDVGGVPQKTLAVEQAGATVFFVPSPELAAARSKASPSLHVYAANTLEQVLSVLKALGGHVPPAPTTP